MTPSRASSGRSGPSGLRNPYRFSFHPTTGAMRINDVGAGAWEEVNAGQAGRNYGWPTCEGMCSNSFAHEPHLRARARRRRGGRTVRHHWWHFLHRQPVSSGVSGQLLRRRLLQHLAAPSAIRQFVRDVPVDHPAVLRRFEVGPRRQPCWCLGHGAGVISRITSSGGGSNRNPTAQFTANPTSGVPPLAVNFDGRGSSDPDGDALTYSWQFGDNTSGSGATTSHTYSSSGTFVATADCFGRQRGQRLAAEQHLRWQPADGNDHGRLPTARCIRRERRSASRASHGSGRRQPASQRLQLDGAVPSRHPYASGAGATERRHLGLVRAPTVGHTEDTVFYRIYLTVTDSSGVQTQVTRDVTPRKARITLTSNIAGRASPARWPAAGNPDVVHRGRWRSQDSRRGVSADGQRSELPVFIVVGWRGCQSHDQLAAHGHDLYGDADDILATAASSAATDGAFVNAAVEV